MERKKEKYIASTILIVLLCILTCFLTYRITNNTPGDYGLSKIEEIIEHNKDLNYTKLIYNNCSKFKNASERFDCVGNFLIANVEFVRRNEIYSIDDMFDLGADCKSYSIYYATLADMFGYDYSFFYTSKHVTTLVDYGNGYCLLDGKFVSCFDYSDTMN